MARKTLTTPSAPSRASRGATSAEPVIDRAKLRDALRTMGDEYVFYMLDEAIDLIPPRKLTKLVGQYIPIERLRPDSTTASAKSLVDEVRAFDAAARAGRYYVAFGVDSKNYMETSSGTRAFIADCQRLLDRCVAQAQKLPPADSRQAFEILFALVRAIDDGTDDIVFFADEGGSWMIGVDWKKVFPAWFRCLARTTTPDEFAKGVVANVDAFEEFSRDAWFEKARKAATAAQRRALDASLAVAPTRRR